MGGLPHGSILYAIFKGKWIKVLCISTHDVGDSVLRIISERLKANTRSDDTVCRLGGDEFVFLLMEVKNKQAIALIAQSLHKIIRQPCVIKKNDSVLRFSIISSIGISI